ncbi:hypothetical protein FA95DRAFT_947217 [Auriscalpium vulgare]|uniref:Uncharacterized protein n=1 Tax=Auriscalpium vulgare TaxID=40419 RepID=A0ACB8RZ27_9AGAM|nr:hypothetical protein FA95DRAFT_947217 [Auriscalpium vulgare]
MAPSKSRAVERDEGRLKRFESIFQRLKQLGYEDIDIDYARSSMKYGVSAYRELTDRSWSHMRPKLEALLKRKRAERLKYAREDVERHRAAVAETRFEEKLATFLPTQLFYVPAPFQIRGFPSIMTLIKQHDDPTPDAWTECMDQLPPELINWMHRKRDEYTEGISPGASGDLLPSMELVPLTSPTINAVRATRNHMFAGALELARAVFTFQNVVLIGRELCHTWKMRYMSRAPAFAPDGAAAASAVIEALGLDNNKATATDLDGLDRRFLCGNCLGADNVTKTLAYSWRACVAHQIHCRSPRPVADRHVNPQWMLIGAEETELIKAREKWTPKEWSRWVCNHCADCKQQEQRAVIAHLKEHHSVTESVEDVDMFLYYPPGKCTEYPKPVSYKVKPPTPPKPRKPSKPLKSLQGDGGDGGRYICIHCKPLARTFNIGGVKQHIQAKHKQNLSPGPSHDGHGVHYEPVA